MMRLLFVSGCSWCCALFAADVNVVFQEDFADISLPAWHGSRDPSMTVSSVAGPDGGPALCIDAPEVGTTTFSAPLPVEQIAGKGVLLDVWRKAEKVRGGKKHYHNAKSMLSWKVKGAAKPRYSTTQFSDFSGTFDWERHRYVIVMPRELEWANVSIGLQGCKGRASWAKLTVRIDPRFPTQAALERYLARKQREAYANIDVTAVEITTLDGGAVQLLIDKRYVPRKYWTAGIRKRVLAVIPPPARVEEGPSFAAALARQFRLRAEELRRGLPALSDGAANDRVCEIAGLRERVRQLGRRNIKATVVRLTARESGRRQISPLIFGNNINAQNLSAPYDSDRGKFQDEFLARVRPMGITFLRYPGGCNADVFNWRDTVGPLDKRKDLINYHNGTSRGTPRFGVDEYLRFCKEEGMVPIITTAFCKDLPSRIDPNDHPNGVRHPFVFEYIKSAPDRVQLAADWVEYCNGSPDTPLGRLRAANGHPEPYHVKYWEIGNESYGPDPVGSCSAEEYAAAFPRYVKAMKARDPRISIVMNGGPSAEWNDTILRLAGKAADAFQFHIYLTPRIGDYGKLLGRPHQVTDGMRLADSIPSTLAALEGQMRRHLGRTLPVIVSEFGMGNARNREFMTSVTSSVLVADMWRALVESPLVFGANKWCLYTGYWFSQIQGPTLRNPNAPYYNRPEQIMHTIYARCRGKIVLPVDNEVSDGVKAVVFERPGSYGVVLISREAVARQSVLLDLPAAAAVEAECLLVTATHPCLGNERDHDLVRPYGFRFKFVPGQPIVVPSNSVMGLIIPRR
ncbi:MAG: hypothetical protein GXP31_02230 [Kiritimatiellaeota bacterium]|nr:hypothetical protein [Kiritimatiellota bacterium]